MTGFTQTRFVQTPLHFLTPHSNTSLSGCPNRQKIPVNLTGPSIQRHTTLSDSIDLSLHVPSCNPVVLSLLTLAPAIGFYLLMVFPTRGSSPSSDMTMDTSSAYADASRPSYSLFRVLLIPSSCCSDCLTAIAYKGKKWNLWRTERSI